MKRRSGQKGNFIRRGCILIGALICALASFCIALPAADQVKAETVTDTLTIKIGYWGMPETEYVTKAEYHWTQLQKELPVYEQAYSYFRDKENRSYAVIVAAARGFYLEDILNHAGVNVSDVENISFYTNDYAAGAFTSFTPSQLLSEPRYYYDNLASHINNEFNDAGILTGYSVDPSAYDNREQVPTMLALESNWNTFEAGTENTNPVFSGLSTGSRFRLLFGQTDPTEMRTNQSAKYVHTIALTIPGSPEIKGGSGDYTGKIMLSTKLGRHTVTFDVAADEAMLDTIRQKLVWTSSDDSVLRIENIAMDPSAEYDDAVTVRIDYEVLKEGARAAIQGDFMGMQLQGSTIETDPAADGDSEQDQEGGGQPHAGNARFQQDLQRHVMHMVKISRPDRIFFEAFLPERRGGAHKQNLRAVPDGLENRFPGRRSAGQGIDVADLSFLGLFDLRRRFLCRGFFGRRRLWGSGGFFCGR